MDDKSDHEEVDALHVGPALGEDCLWSPGRIEANHPTDCLVNWL